MLNNYEESSRHFDDPVPITVFTGSRKMVRRQRSAPPDVAHHWVESNHTHDAVNVKLGVAASDSNLAAVAISDISSFKRDPDERESAATTTELLADSMENTSLEEQQTEEEGKKGPVPELSGPQSKQDPNSLGPSPVNGSSNRDSGTVSRTDTMEFKVSEAELAATLDAQGSNQNVPPTPVYHTERVREEANILPEATFFIPNSSPGSSNRSSLTPPLHTPKETFSNSLFLPPQDHEAPESHHQPVPVQTDLPPVNHNPPECTSSQTDASNSFSSGSYTTRHEVEAVRDLKGVLLSMNGRFPHNSRSSMNKRGVYHV